MATITYDAEGPGKGGIRPMSTQASRPMKIVSGQFSFDSSYPTGGEDISEIFGMFQTDAKCLGIWMEDPTDSAGTGLSVVIDYTNKLAMLFTNAADPAEVANASDQSGAASLRWFAWGFI